jgi:hypothetical protein
MRTAKYGEPGSLVARNIRPAFALELVFVCDAIRALKVALPVRAWETKLNWSLVP